MDRFARRHLRERRYAKSCIATIVDSANRMNMDEINYYGGEFREIASTRHAYR